MNETLVIAQTGGPTPVINATLSGLVRAAQTSGAFRRVVGLRHGLEGALSGAFIDLTTLSDGELTRLAYTPGAALGGSRCKVQDAEYSRILDSFRAQSVTACALVGGNGTMHVAQQLAEYVGDTLRVVGVPKTIDNDLAGTDHTPGYGSAARFMALAARDCGLDLEAMQTFDDVVILEAMGRDTGWLTAASALLKEHDDDAPHLLYPPEIPFDEERFLADIARVHARLKHVFVVVGEGIRDTAGNFVGQMTSGAVDPLGRTVYALTDGPAAYLTRLVRQRLGLQTRFLRPGLIGRSLSACISPVDRDEACRAGEAAARALAESQTGVMVSLTRSLPFSMYGEGVGGWGSLPYQCKTCLVPLMDASGLKQLPREFLDDNGTMISPAFRAYARPLIGEVEPVARL